MTRKARMEDQTGAAVLPFPAHRRTTIDQTLEGFPGRAADNGLPGRRSARRVTVLFSEIRGWKQVSERAGTTAAAEALASAVDGAVAAMREGAAVEVTVEGGSVQPTLWATFEGEDHAARALRAAVAVRDFVGEAPLPELGGHRFHACSG